MESPPTFLSSIFVAGSRQRDGVGGALISVLRKIIYALLTCVFVTVGSIIGALVVILGGKDENMGFLHGIGVGALSGAILAMEILDSFLAFLNSHPSQSRGTLLLVIKFSCGYVSRKIVQERVTQAIYATLPRQENDLEEPRDIFDTETLPNGLSLLALQQLGRANFDVTQKDGSTPTCAICLQDFQQGEDIRKLPLCSHTFHLPCVDAWLARHGTCPLCRRHFGH
ncbi:NEP1-interacting protein-like 1 [Nymphaea colorata]|nr:NEP1-interacting protein-like 1 [Nymphaea colorata]